MDRKLELLLRAICAYEIGGEANFALRNLDFFGSENTIRRNIEKIEQLVTEDGKPYIIQTNMNGCYSKFRINKVLECPEFIYDKSFPVMYKVILLALYNLETIPEILTISGISKLTNISYNTVKKYFRESIREDLLNNSSPIKLDLEGELENSDYGLKYVGARKDTYKCQYCGEENPDLFYSHNHSTCKKCLVQRNKNSFLTDMAKKLLSSSKKSYAHRPNIDGYDLTKEYIQELLEKQEYKCYYTGVDLKIGDKLTNPTLDRIDSSKGYVKGNVVICTEIANIMKNDLSIPEIKHQIELWYNNINNY